LEEPKAPAGFIDESGNFCLVQLDEVVKESISRHGTREKTRSSQKRRKKKKVKKPQPEKEFGKKNKKQFSFLWFLRLCDLF
jgi:hypothetical protein